jgi:hypothetical protein
MKIPARFSKFAIDLAERVLWTAAEAGVGVVAAELTHLDPAFAVAIATVAAAVKGFIAKHLGNPDSAATLPASVDPTV